MAEVTLKGSKVHTNGELPEVGSLAKDFKLVDKDFNNRTLKDFGSKRKLLSVVVSMDTPECIISSRKFNEALKAHPAVVALIISGDLPFAQNRLCIADKLENIITLSMVRSKDFARDYGILLIDGPLEGLSARAVLVLDENNKVVYKQLVPEIVREPDYEPALQALLQKS